MSAVQICPTSVFTLSTSSELTLQQRTALYLIEQHCFETQSVMGIGAIKRFGIFHSHAQAVYQINELITGGWLFVHEGCFKPSPKAINWLSANGVSRNRFPQ